MIVVTAPTGNIGHRVVQNLLEVGKQIRVIVRDATKLAPHVRDRVEVVEGSHGDAAVVSHAFAKSEAVFWVVPPAPQKTLKEAYVGFTQPAAAAIQQHNVPHIVCITALGRGTQWQDKAGLVSASINMDDLLMQTGVAFRGLAMPSFMDNVRQHAASIKSQGTFFGTINPDKKLPTTAARDIGTEVARLLADTQLERSEGDRSAGPESLSMNEWRRSCRKCSSGMSTTSRFLSIRSRSNWPAEVCLNRLRKVTLT